MAYESVYLEKELSIDQIYSELPVKLTLVMLK